MKTPCEIVILTDLDAAHLVEFAAWLDASFTAWAEAGLIGDQALWAIYPTQLTIPGQLALFEL